MSTKVEVAPVRSESDYLDALRRIDQLFDAPEGTPEFDEFDVLTILVHEYEKVRYPVEPSSPAAALRHYLDRTGSAPRDLEPFIGSKSTVSMVLNGRRPLTVKMIRSLHEGLGIPLALLI